MTPPRQQWLLKVIAGPHQGAEIALRAGKTLIGSDDECDVVLHDVLIAPQHLELELGADGTFAAPLGGRVFVDGKRIRDARQSVADFAFLSLGGTHLVLGPTEGAWPLLSAADAPELEKEAPPAPEEAAPSDPEAAAEPQSDEAEVKPEPVATPPVATTTTRSRRPWIGIAAGLLMLLGWAVIFERMQSRGESVAGVVSKSELRPLDRAKAIVAELGLSEVVSVEESGGRLSASGYVDTEARQRELQAAFREEMPGLRPKIYSMEKIAASARSLMDAQRLPLEVTSLADGKLKVSGKLNSAEPWAQMRSTLLREVPGLTGIEDSVEIPKPVPMAVASAQAVVLPPPQPAVAAPAQPAAKTIPLPPPVGQVPEQTEPEEPADEFDVFVTPDTIDRPEAVIAMIRADRPGTEFLRLSTGGVYFVGARLPYGGIVTRIEPNRITVVEQDVTRTHAIGEPVTRTLNTATTANKPAKP